MFDNPCGDGKTWYFGMCVCVWRVGSGRLEVNRRRRAKSQILVISRYFTKKTSVFPKVGVCKRVWSSLKKKMNREANSKAFSLIVCCWQATHTLHWLCEAYVNGRFHSQQYVCAFVHNIEKSKWMYLCALPLYFSLSLSLPFPMLLLILFSRFVISYHVL